MASDGLIFKFFAKLTPKFKSPLTATLFTGLSSAVLSLIIDLDELIEMMSIGTLMAYSITALCVLILRYRPFERDNDEQQPEATHSSVLATWFGHLNGQSLLARLFRPNTPCSHFNSRLVNLLTFLCGNIAEKCSYSSTLLFSI